MLWAFTYACMRHVWGGGIQSVNVGNSIRNRLCVLRKYMHLNFIYSNKWEFPSEF